MAPVDELLPLLSSCYNAVSDPGLWRPFTEQLQSTFGSDRVYFNAVADEPAQALLHVSGCHPEILVDYASYWHRHDVILQAVTEQLRKHGLWRGELESILPRTTLRSSHLYNDSPDFRGLHSMIGTSSARLSGFQVVGLGIWRRDTQGAFAAEHLQLLRLLEPHLFQAVRLHAQLIGLRAEADLFRAGVEVPGTAFLALDPTGRILLASPAALALLHPPPHHSAGHHGLLESHGRLCAADPAIDRSLQHALHTAASIASLSPEALVRPSPPGLSSLAIPRPASPHPLLLQLTPFRGAFHAVCPAALVFLTDPDSTPPTRDHLLRDLFDLSPTEASLANHLLHGLELREAGDRLRLSYDSARFHLKQVFRKTGTRRQSELLHLLARLPTL